MKTQQFILCFGLFLFLFVPSYLKAQEECEISENHYQGYTSTIASVIDNGDNSYTITLRVDFDGTCSWFDLNRYSVQADVGTYSDISVEILSGDVSYSYIDDGPLLWGDFFLGFRVLGIDNMGHGQPGSFELTYTLSGGLQNQYVRANVPFSIQHRRFSVSDFEEVMACQEELAEPPIQIFPYYEPLEEGKSYDIIGSELTSLHNTYLQNGTYISDDIFQIVSSSVIISIQTQEGQYANAMALLTTPTYGLEQAIGNAANNVISGIYPVANLLLLNELPELLVSVSPVYSALANAGLIDSQGDQAMRSDAARKVFDVNGSGVKVGVLSDSYNTALGNLAGDDAIKGDLPGPDNESYPTPIDLILDYPFGIRSDEGRAMMQIVHDVAPGAELAFRTGFLGPVDMANGIIELEQSGCDIIVDDVTYISEPFFRDGVVAQAVDQVNAEGVSYFSSAGNFGTKSWQGTFNPEPAPNDILGEAHNFAEGGAVDIFQNITLYEGQYTVVLQWDDGTAGNTTNSDYDIYLSYDNGNTLFGFNRVNTGGAPLEVLPFTVAAESVQSNFMIIRASGSGPAVLKYIVYRGTIDINEYDTPNASTIAGHPNAEGAMAVGAVLYSNTPEIGGVAPTIASFSSRGGTNVNGIDRNKPDFCAPNGVNTSVDLGGVNIDGDEFPNFFGTSASAPHAAGLAALLIEARQKYYDDVLTPDLVKGVLQSTAYDMEEPGYDPASGAGFILADSALISLANPKPAIEYISYDTSLTPGIDDIWLTIHGEYLNEDSEVWFDGEPIVSETVMEGNTSISTLIPSFQSLYPAIQVYNSPKEGTNGLDGGLSNALYFDVKQTILVEVDDHSKKYGEMIPEFTATYSLETVDGGMPLDSAGLTSAELDRIYSIPLKTVANNFSNVGLWGIEADSDDPLAPESEVEASQELDISLLQRFNFVFHNGLLNIDPLDLKVTPRDTTFVYNDTIGNFSFDYLFNDSANVSFEDGDSLAIANLIRSIHGTALVNHQRSVLVRGTALVNDLGEEIIDEEVLLNTSVMISELAYQIRGTALVNGEAIDAEDLYEAALVNGLEVTSLPARLVRGTALVNGYQLVRGTALVNDIDSSGNVVNSFPLVNADALVNSTGILNATTINADSNFETIVILSEGDIAILSGDSVGNVVMRSINLITGETVGTHLSVPGTFVSNNFNITYGVGHFTVTPAEAEFEIDTEQPLVFDYDGTPKSVSATALPDDIELLITYNGDTVPPTNAGTYEVLVTDADGNYSGSAEATLLINPISASVTTGDYYITQIQDLPAFEAAYGGLISGDENSESLSLSFEISPEFLGETGVYNIVPVPSSVNYIFTTENGTLYVNPGGPGTKPIFPSFLCRDEFYEADENGFYHLAHFAYENQNDANVYIPKGPHNKFVGVARDASDQPTVFTPGWSYFDVPYAGGNLKWVVKSYNSTGLRTKRAIVSDQPCGGPAIAGQSNPPLEDTGSEMTALAYPNPSTGIVYIQLEGVEANQALVEVFDFLGRKCEVTAINSSEQILEIDLTKFDTGLYIIRVSDHDWNERINVFVK